MVNSWRSLLLLLLVCALFVGTASAASVQAVADRNRIAVGESLQLQLRVDGSPDGEPDLSGLEQNWEILNRSQSSQMQIINGSFSRSEVYSLTLMPRAQGTVMIPAVCFAKDCSLPLPIDVSPTPSSKSGFDEALLLETEVTPQKIVSEGQLLFKVRLLRRVNLLEGQLNEPNPAGVTAVVKKLGDDRSYETRRNGQLYQVIERSYAIFPQESGEMLIPPLQFDGRIPAAPSRFDPFGQQGQRVRRTSQALTVEVAPLPADLGRRPWIPATALQLQDDWQQQPPKLTVGEPATRTLRLIATGVPAAQLPELKPEIPAEFKSYPDQPKRDDQLNVRGVTGYLEQKIAFIPTRAGHFSLPAFKLDWWDISTERWRSVELKALEFEVAPAAGGTALTPQTPQKPAVSDETLSPANPPTEAAGPATLLKVDSAPVDAEFWPWLSLGLGLGWLLTLILLWRLLRRTQPARIKPQPDLQPTEKSARKAALQAARANDPQATRQALLAWSRILWPNCQESAYEHLRQSAEPSMRQQLAQLDESLYGCATRAWDGQAMADAIASWQATSTRDRKERLPDLYP